jgi:hypothetical protein
MKKCRDSLNHCCDRCGKRLDNKCACMCHECYDRVKDLDCDEIDAIIEKKRGRM